MITGIVTFSDTISYPTFAENYTYENDSLISVTQELTPTPINSTLNFILSWVIMILGLSGIIGSSIKLYDSRYDEADPEQIQIFDK